MNSVINNIFSLWADDYYVIVLGLTLNFRNINVEICFKKFCVNCIDINLKYIIGIPLFICLENITENMLSFVILIIILYKNTCNKKKSNDNGLGIMVINRKYWLKKKLIRRNYT